jgi:hypothetical protein
VLVIEETDFEKEVFNVMSAFRGFLLCYYISHDVMPPLQEYSDAAWKALERLMAIAFPIENDICPTSIRSHFEVKLEYLSQDSDVVALVIEPRTEMGTRLLDVMERVGVSFT